MRHRDIPGFVYVYTLSDLLGSIFYVGSTSTPLVVRLAGHLAEARNSPPWGNLKKIDKIRSSNFDVLIKEVDRIWISPTDKAGLVKQSRPLEFKWMATFHKMGYELTNGRELAAALKMYEDLTVNVQGLT